jgi:hypothetical protein
MQRKTKFFRGVAFCDGALGSIPKIIFVNFIIFVFFVISGIEVACRSKEEGELYKNYNLNYNFYIKGVIDILYVYICAYV